MTSWVDAQGSRICDGQWHEGSRVLKDVLIAIAHMCLEPSNSIPKVTMLKVATVKLWKSLCRFYGWRVCGVEDELEP